MFNKLCWLLIILSFFFVSGCASVNKGAEEVGKTGGKIMRVPGSVSEGAAEGIAGEPESNPYNR